MNETALRATDTAARLLHDFRANKLSHAYLIIGERGSGKRTLAQAFAQLLLCEAPGAAAPCGACQSCVYFNSFNTHPGLTVLERDAKKASIGIGEVRDATAGIYEAPYIGPRKLYLIPQAELLTVQAQNALLKILEEPPEHAVFILLSANRQAMLSTVLSRCRTLSMSPHSKEALRQILAEKEPLMSSQEADSLIRRSCGLPGRLVALLDREEAALQQAELSAAVTALLNSDIEKLLELAGKADPREKALRFSENLAGFMRDAAVYLITGDPSLIVNEDQKPLLQQLTGAAPLKKIVDYITLIQDTQKKLLANASHTLCIKTLLLKW